MTIVNPNNQTVTIHFFNRYSETPFKIEFYNESTRNVDTKNIVTLQEGSYYNIATMDNDNFFKENNSYVMRIKSENDIVLFVDKVFSTSQNIIDYSINADLYTTNTTEQEYTIYE